MSELLKSFILNDISSSDTANLIFIITNLESSTVSENTCDTRGTGKGCGRNL